VALLRAGDGSPVPTPAATGSDAVWLERAVSLAADNVAAGGGPFAAMVLRDGRLVGRGVNRVTRNNDATAHAEVVAIRDACRRLAHFRLTGCQLVTSCEPCPMCLGAALWAHIGRVVYAADRHDAARGGFDDHELHRLFDTERSALPIPVERVPVSDPAAPFLVWRDHVERVAY
jgi:guanine deaminase